MCEATWVTWVKALAINAIYSPPALSPCGPLMPSTTCNPPPPSPPGYFVSFNFSLSLRLARHKTLTTSVFLDFLSTFFPISCFFPLIFVFILSVCSSQVSTSHRAGTTLKCQEEQNIQMQNLFPDYSDAKAIPRTCCAYFTQPGNLIFAKRF